VRSSLVMNQRCCHTAALLSTAIPALPHAARENPAVRKSVRRVVGVGILAGIGYALWRNVAPATPSAPVGWEPQPFPFPPLPATGDESPASAWVDADADGGCPPGYPVKGKLASGIFHVAAGANYERTRADRCYVSAEAAEADGLRASKR
jgi:hypothetical protein